MERNNNYSFNSLSPISYLSERIFEVYNYISEWSANFYKQIKPTIEALHTLTQINEIAKLMADNQFILFDKISIDIFDRPVNESIDKYLFEHFISDKQINNIVMSCNLDNRVFTQSLSSYKNDWFDLAIIGFTSILDMLLSKYSEKIKNVNIKSRCDTIVKKVEEKGDLYLDELEIQDYLLFLTYPRTLDLFGDNSDFSCEESELLNRHWIMHGRTLKAYTKLDCAKVLRMIYGTIRMGQLGLQDTSSNNCL